MNKLFMYFCPSHFMYKLYRLFIHMIQYILRSFGNFGLYVMGGAILDWASCSSFFFLFHWLNFSFSFRIFFFFVFLGLHPQHMEVPRQGVKSDLWLPAYATAQQLGMGATSATYTTAHGNTGSLTHWARPRTSSWILAGFITTEPQGNSQNLFFFF